MPSRAIQPPDAFDDAGNLLNKIWGCDEPTGPRITGRANWAGGALARDIGTGDVHINKGHGGIQRAWRYADGVNGTLALAERQQWARRAKSRMAWDPPYGWVAR